MAVIIKPSKFPRWADEPTNPIPGTTVPPITEPGESVKDQGWVLEKPPVGIMNWLQNLAYQWMLSLDDENNRKFGRLRANLKQATEFGMAYSASRNPEVAIPNSIEYAIFAAGYIFGSSTNGTTVYKIDPNTNLVVDTWAVFSSPHGMAFDGTYLWVANYTENHPGTISVVNIDTGAVVYTVTNAGGQGICFDGTHMWAMGSTPTGLKKINISTYAVDATVTLTTGDDDLDPDDLYPHDFVFDGLYVWCSNYGVGAGHSVMKVDIATNLQVAVIRAGTGSDRLLFDGTHVWVSNRWSDNIMKIDPVTDTVVATVALTHGDNPIYFGFDGRYVWCALEGSGKIVRIDPLTATITHTLTITAGNPRGMAFDGIYMWCGLSSAKFFHKIPVL